MANTFKSPLQKAVVGWLAAHPEVSITELGRRAEIDRGDLSKINSGQKASLNMESAARLAHAMGTTVEGLLTGDAAATPAAGPGPNDVRIDGQALAVGVRLVPLSIIDPSPDNPRKTFDKDALAELAASIAEQGLLQPLVVRPNGGRFTIVAGERRFRALTLNGADDALCMVREGADDGNTRALRIIENLQRADIKPMEEAEAFSALNAVDPVKWTATAIGKAIGKSDRFVAQRISVARNLHPDLKDKLVKGELKIEVARVMAGAPQKLQKSLANDPWALRDPDDCRRKLQGKAIPVSAAAFKLDEYDGEFLEEGGKRWFADKAKFTRLQTKTADARVEKLKKDWPEAKRIGSTEVRNLVWADTGDNVQGWYGEPKRTEAKTRKRGLTVADCTAVVWIAENKIHTAKNVVTREVWDEKVKKDQPKAQHAGGHAERAERETKEQKQARAVNEALTAGLAQRPDLAKRLVVYAFLGQNVADIEIDIDPRPHFGDQAELLDRFVGGDGYYLDRYEAPTGADDKLWAALRAMDESAIDGLLGRFMSEIIHLPTGYFQAKADGLCRAIAAELSVDIPAAMIPEPVAAEPVPGEEAGDAVDQAVAA
ncbi:ParB/RepB/Spo0J family partition protein [Reyranella sp.]|uniref:ParB/RepB/Spo0J family partition protein n=1 Tax=Reyranella sp. TaxID=1929291 RepID=UPI003F6F0543